MSDATANPPAPDEQKPKLRPANNNPWYLLATLHGEQPEGAGLLNIDSAFDVMNLRRSNHWSASVTASGMLDDDKQLHAMNRRAWNRYMATIAAPDVLAKAMVLKKKDGSPRISSEELLPYAGDEYAELLEKFQKRGGNKLPTGNTYFELTFFASAAAFEGFWFSQDVYFNWSQFAGEAGFINATFGGRAEFSGATFFGPAWFGGAAFYDEASFANVTFSGHAWFDSSAFHNYTWFSHVAFFKDASFVNVSFSNHVGIEGVTFSKNAMFVSTVFSGNTSFDQASFDGDADFRLSTFVGSLSFAGVNFRTSPPNFNGTPILFEGTIWPGPEGWPAAPSNIGKAQQHLSYYQRLKKDAETHKKHRQEMFFFAKELECQQVIEGWRQGWPTKLYGLFSDFGTSISKPLKGLGAIWAMCGMAYENLTAMTTAQAWGFSAASLFDVLGARKNFFEAEMKGMSGLAAIIATSQTAFGLLFLFLIGLALRNRFRMK